MKSLLLVVMLFSANIVMAHPVHSNQCRSLDSVPVGLLSDHRVLMTLAQLAANNAGVEGNRLDVVYCLNSPEKATYLFIHTGFEMPSPERPAQHSMHFDVNMYVLQGSAYIESVGVIENGAPQFQ